MMVKYKAGGLGVLTAIALLEVVWGYCPKGWVKGGQKCYRVFPPNGKSQSFDEIENQYCRKNGGLLMNMKTREVNDLAIDLMQSVGLSLKERAIMGLNDRQTEGQYKWSDGTSLDKSWINWHTGEPNNQANPPIGEDCANILQSGKWNDIPCYPLELNHAILCEKPTEDDDVSLAADRGYTGFYELRTGMYGIYSTVEMPSLVGCAVLCSRHDNCRGIHFRVIVTSECVLLEESTENDAFNCELVDCYIKS